MKVSLKELRGAIQMIIKEEVAKILPRMLAEALAEKYLKKVMGEVVAATSPARAPARAPSNRRPANLRELMQGDAEAETDWEEEVPQAMDNDHKGIYHQSPLVRGKGGQSTNEARKRALAMVYDEDPETALEDPRFRQREEAVNRLTQGNPDMAMMFEGTRPAIPEQKSGGAVMGETQQLYGEEGVPLDFLGKIGVNFAKVKENVDGPVPEAAKEKVDEEYLKALERRRAQLNQRPPQVG